MTLDVSLSLSPDAQYRASNFGHLDVRLIPLQMFTYFMLPPVTTPAYASAFQHYEIVNRRDRESS